MAYSKEQIQARYRSLPEDLRQAIFDTEISETLQKIGKENSLNIEQTGILADEAGLLMMGLIAPKDFIPNLTKRMGINKEKARKITQEVNDRIFSKIRESLKKIHSQEKKKEERPQIKPTEPKKTTGSIMPPIIRPGNSFMAKPAPKETNEKVKTEKLMKTKKPAEAEEKEEIFRSKPVVTERPHPDKLSGRHSYEPNQDPYREPLD
jgi:hypothetical protein